MAIDRPDWTEGVDIEAQTVDEIAVNIAAQTLGTIKADIIAQTVENLTVDLAAQTLEQLNINILQQGIGIYLQPTWAAKEGTDKDFEVVDTSLGYAGNIEVVYDVPAGKTLYMTDISFTIRPHDREFADHNLIFLAYVLDTTAAAHFLRVTGSNGASEHLIRPAPTPGPHEFKALLYNMSPVLVNMGIHVSGFEV